MEVRLGVLVQKDGAMGWQSLWATNRGTGGSRGVAVWDSVTWDFLESFDGSGSWEKRGVDRPAHAQASFDRWPISIWGIKPEARSSSVLRLRHEQPGCGSLNGNPDNTFRVVKTGMNTIFLRTLIGGRVPGTMLDDG